MVALAAIRPIKNKLILGSHITCEIFYLILCVVMVIQSQENDLSVAALCVPVFIEFVLLASIVVVYIIFSGEGKKFDEFVLVKQSRFVRAETYIPEDDNQKPHVAYD